MKTDPDPLLDELRALPPHAADPTFDARAQQEAKRAYLRSFDGGARGDTMARMGRTLMPVFLAMVVGLYMTWAIASATALVQ
jgi:hypothetical protein